MSQVGFFTHLLPDVSGPDQVFVPPLVPLPIFLTHSGTEHNTTLGRAWLGSLMRYDFYRGNPLPTFWKLRFPGFIVFYVRIKHKSFFEFVSDRAVLLPLIGFALPFSVRKNIIYQYKSQRSAHCQSTLRFTHVYQH